MKTNIRKLEWHEVNALKDALLNIRGLESILTKAIEKGEIATSVILEWPNPTKEQSELIKSNNEVHLSKSYPLFLRRAATDISNVLKNH